MNWILCAIIFLAGLVIVAFSIMYFTLKKSSSSNHSSKYILNKFEPDNTVPKLTDMIEFHKENQSAKYKID